MEIHLLAVGTRMPAWVESGFADYAQRLPRELKLLLTEIPLAQRGKNADLARAKQQEGERLLARVPRGARLIALDERGESWTSAELARQLQSWMESGQAAALLVGGPDGHADEVLQRARQRWSLSRLTLPHALVRVLVAEQIYRAWSLLAHHPYHRA
jgi:23S rRNA (pseudouridine1915-N3)-methyltransferase